MGPFLGFLADLADPKKALVGAFCVGHLGPDSMAFGAGKRCKTPHEDGAFLGGSSEIRRLSAGFDFLCRISSGGSWEPRKMAPEPRFSYGAKIIRKPVTPPQKPKDFDGFSLCHFYGGPPQNRSTSKKVGSYRMAPPILSWGFSWSTNWALSWSFLVVF